MDLIAAGQLIANEGQGGLVVECWAKSRAQKEDEKLPPRDEALEGWRWEIR